MKCIKSLGSRVHIEGREYAHTNGNISVLVMRYFKAVASVPTILICMCM